MLPHRINHDESKVKETKINQIMLNNYTMYRTQCARLLNQQHHPTFIRQLFIIVNNIAHNRNYKLKKEKDLIIDLIQF